MSIQRHRRFGELDFLVKWCDFIDKTLIIKEFLEDSGKIVLLPRPRRFGKTLNLSIIRYFLEKTEEDTSYLFKNLNIEKEKEIMKKQGKYPLIYLTFKDDKHRNFENFIDIFRFKISDEYSRFMFLLDKLDEQNKQYFNDILFRRASVSQLEISILKLSEYLNKYYNHKVIILIDEYDTPIHHSYFEGYYDEMVGFTRNLLSACLKDNINIEKAMITGILRVAKESIFSGLNNLKVYTLLKKEYSQVFGFTEDEINKLLLYYNEVDKREEFKKWYNGYNFGQTTIYNPWSTLYYLSSVDKYFMPYWINTSENKIVKTLLAKGDEDIKLGLENLYKGGYVETTINEDVVMKEIDNGEENIWSFLLLSGYLKVVDKYFENKKFVYKLKIPNEEITCLYENIIGKWFIEGYGSNDYNNMLKALTIGDIELFEEYFSMYMLNSFSYFDTSGNNPERVYHAFVLGMLVSLSLIPKDNTKPGIIMEFKSLRINSKKTLEDAMEKAIEQVNKKLYETELKNRGIDNIMKIAMVFKGKEVLIKEV